MTQSALATVANEALITGNDRRITHRTQGRTQGPITRLMSPGDLGELLKPFVFLDYFETAGFQGKGFAAHPHSSPEADR